MTFDQPLWIEVVEIVESELLNVVCRLGVLYVIMSFHCSIGNVMAGSGFCEALENCYGQNSVAQMMCGKAVAQALRGHFLVESALYVWLLKSLFDSDIVSETDVAQLRAVYDTVVSIKVMAWDVEVPQCLVKLGSACSEHMTSLALVSRTAKLWLQYMQYVDVLRTVIRAESLREPVIGICT